MMTEGSIFIEEYLEFERGRVLPFSDLAFLPNIGKLGVHFLLLAGSIFRGSEISGMSVVN